MIVSPNPTQVMTLPNARMATTINAGYFIFLSLLARPLTIYVLHFPSIQEMNPFHQMQSMKKSPIHPFQHLSIQVSLLNDMYVYVSTYSMANYSLKSRQDCSKCN